MRAGAALPAGAGAASGDVSAGSGASPWHLPGRRDSSPGVLLNVLGEDGRSVGYHDEES